MRSALRFGSLLLVTGLTMCHGVVSSEESIVYTALRPSNWDLYLFDNPGKQPRRLTDDPALDYNPTISPDGRWVVFCSERQGNPDLYALDLNRNGAPRQLTDSDAMEDAPTIAPNGQAMAFVSTRSGNADIFIMSFDSKDPQGSANAVNLTRHPAGDFNPAFSPDGQWIAFASDRDGYKASEIYLMRTDGSDLRRLTEEEGWDGSPAWSADGTTIYFYSERDEGTRIFRMQRDGSDPQPVSREGESALSSTFMPDGRLAYGVRTTDRWDIISVAVDGTDRRVESDSQRDYWAPTFSAHGDGMICFGPGPPGEGPTFDSSTPGPFLVDNRQTAKLPDRTIRLWAIRGYFPALSPEGNQVASDEGFHGIVISELDGTSMRDAYRPASQHAWRPTWSKDNMWLACTVGPTFAAPEAETDIWKFRTDGSEKVNLTAGSAANDAFPDFSPDGTQIAFRSGRDGNHEIYLMNRDGGGLRRLTHHDAVDTMPAFSTQGDQIAFTSKRTGDYEIHLLDLSNDGSPGKLRRITHAKGRDTHPKFSPDGEWLTFASERGGLNDETPLIPVFNPQPYGEIYAVRLQDGKVVRLTHNKWEDGTPTWGRIRTTPAETLADKRTGL